MHTLPTCWLMGDKYPLQVCCNSFTIQMKNSVYLFSHMLRPPRGVHWAHLQQAYKPCFIKAISSQTSDNVCWWPPSHRFVRTLLKWYKVNSLRRWTSRTPRGGLKDGSWNWGVSAHLPYQCHWHTKGKVILNGFKSVSVRVHHHCRFVQSVNISHH